LLVSFSGRMGKSHSPLELLLWYWACCCLGFSILYASYLSILYHHWNSLADIFQAADSMDSGCCAQNESDSNRRISDAFGEESKWPH
jgi:hypothetical protein